MLQQSYIAGPTLLPFPGVSIELEELCSHLESLFFELLMCLNFDLLSQANDGFEVDILCLLNFLLRFTG
jgi:hypothetical protein